LQLYFALKHLETGPSIRSFCEVINLNWGSHVKVHILFDKMWLPTLSFHKDLQHVTCRISYPTTKFIHNFNKCLFKIYGHSLIMKLKQLTKKITRLIIKRRSEWLTIAFISFLNKENNSNTFCFFMKSLQNKLIDLSRKYLFLQTVLTKL
jgi:hypothetical protein